MMLTYRYRVKNLGGFLRRQARMVNCVWNYCNESQKSCRRLGKKSLSGFDLNYLTAGTCKELGLHSQTVQAVCEQYAASRDRKKLPCLRWRGAKSLGWVPFKGPALKMRNSGFIFFKHAFKVFYSRPIPAGAIIRDGSSFSQDARGRWFLNVVLELPDRHREKTGRSVGISLGRKDSAALSTGEIIEAPRRLAGLAGKLAKARRAGKKRQAANIRARIADSRRDFLHKLSTRIVRDFDFIAVGDAARFAPDAGWASLRDMLAYKSHWAGAAFEEVRGNYSTQACSSCGAGLGIRAWCCSACGARHDLDVNSAVNILLGSGHRALAEGIPAPRAGEMSIGLDNLS